MTVNKPMTGEQLDELMTVAVNMQRDSEKAGDRPSAMFAYAVQVAVLELRKVRNDAAALAAENAGMKNGNGTSIEFRDFYAWWNIFNEDGLRSEDERMLAAGAWMARSGLGNTDTYQYVPAVTTATDAFLAEVRASGVEMFAAWNDKHIKKGVEHKESLTAVGHAARGFAGLLRKGVQS